MGMCSLHMFMPGRHGELSSYILWMTSSMHRNQKKVSVTLVGSLYALVALCNGDAIPPPVQLWLKRQIPVAYGVVPASPPLVSRRFPENFPLPRPVPLFFCLTGHLLAHCCLQTHDSVTHLWVVFFVESPAASRKIPQHAPVPSIMHKLHQPQPGCFPGPGCSHTTHQTTL